MRRIFSPRLVVACLVVLGVLAMALWPQTVEVDVAMVTRDRLMVTIDEEGETRVRERFVISAPVTGRLQRVDLEPGDAVEQGRTVLARIQPSAPALLDARSVAETAAAVDAARAAAGQTRAERARVAAALDRARASLRRQRTLVEAGAVSRDAFETAEALALTTEEELRAAEFAVARAEYELQLAEARRRAGGPNGQVIQIVAPVDGVVLRRMRESEATVPAGEPLLELGDPGALEIVTDLLSNDAVRIQPGFPALIEQWGGGHTLHARVRRVEPAGFMKVSALGVEEQRVNAVLDFADGQAAAGTLGDAYRVEVRIVVWDEDDVLTVPVGSLFRDGDTWATFVVAEGRASRRTVQVGQRNQTLAQITGGLEAGQIVVLHPPDTLTDGTAVQVREE
ncbi:MAG: efflux RND transporter periplasmic adaptor subunit [Vicinamibacterales bacterium]